MVTFFPGPSRVYPTIKDYLIEAYESGIMSISHRSETFNQLSAETLGLLRQKLNIPADYTILYTSSATESWEIIPQSLLRQGGHHVYSGSFGEKWFQYAANIKPQSTGTTLGVNEILTLDHLETKAEMICLTQNETSNGTQINEQAIEHVRAAFPEKLIAYDVTSSIAGQALPFHLGDVWFGSVQKCFGLPAGLGLLVLSPRAVEIALDINDQTRYNSLPLMLQHIEKFQTSCTPNVLGIFLLNRVMRDFQGISTADAELKRRAAQYSQWLDNNPKFKPLVSEKSNRSQTVVAVEADAATITHVKQAAKESGLLLGSGYGKWKETTFRIANFPALQPDEVEALLRFLAHYG